MDGENHGKPYEQMDDLGGKPIIFGNIHIFTFPFFPFASKFLCSKTLWGQLMIQAKTMEPWILHDYAAWDRKKYKTPEKTVKDARW